MRAIASQITSLTIVYPKVYSGADKKKHESSASLAFVQGIHRGTHRWPITRKMFPFDDVIMGRLRPYDPNNPAGRQLPNEYINSGIASK